MQMQCFIGFRSILIIIFVFSGVVCISILFRDCVSRKPRRAPQSISFFVLAQSAGSYSLLWRIILILRSLPLEMMLFFMVL